MPSGQALPTQLCEPSPPTRTKSFETRVGGFSSCRCGFNRPSPKREIRPNPYLVATVATVDELKSWQADLANLAGREGTAMLGSGAEAL